MWHLLCMHNKICMEAYEIKWVNPILNIIGINSLRLGDLRITHTVLKCTMIYYVQYLSIIFWRNTIHLYITVTYYWIFIKVFVSCVNIFQHVNKNQINYISILTKISAYLDNFSNFYGSLVWNFHILLLFRREFSCL